MAEINWPIELSVFIDLDTLFTPDIATYILCRNLHLNPPMQDIRVRSHIFGQVPYIAPVATVGDISIERVAIFQHEREKFLAEVKGLIFLKVAKNLRVENINTRIDCIAEYLPPAWLLQKLGYMTIFIGNNHPILQRIMHMR